MDITKTGQSDRTMLIDVLPQGTVATALTGDALVQALATYGFSESNSTKKLKELRSGDLIVYVKRKEKLQPLVVHPDYIRVIGQLRAIEGIDLPDPIRTYKNSNLRSFPAFSAPHRKSEGRHGLAIGIGANQLKAIISILQRESAISAPDGTLEEVANGLESTSLEAPPSLSPPLDSHEADDSTFDPESVLDDRKRAFRAICVRRGQLEFRNELLKAYGQRCAVSGCSVVDVLEAAHISPYKGILTNHVSNGLLLRADIHTLFDCGLLGIDPNSRRVITGGALTGSSYAQFAGRLLRAPKDPAQSPSKKNLLWRFKSFEAFEAHRSEAQGSA